MGAAGEYPPWIVQAAPAGLRIRCRVQPRSSRNAVEGTLGDALKVALTAPPVDGKANAALELFLADFFGVSRRQVHVASGLTGRHKMIEITGLDVTEAIGRVEKA